MRLLRAARGFAPQRLLFMRQPRLRCFGNDSPDAFFQRSGWPPEFEDELVGFVFLERLRGIYRLRAGQYGDFHLPADDFRDFNDFVPFKVGDVKIFVPRDGLVVEREFVETFATIFSV